MLRQVYLLKRRSDLLINLRRGMDDVIVLGTCPAPSRMHNAKLPKQKGG